MPETNSNDDGDAKSVASTASRRSSRRAAASPRPTSPVGSITSTGSRRSSRLANKRKRRTSLTGSEAESSIGKTSSLAATTPRPPPIPEEPAEDRVKRLKKEEENEKDVEMKPAAEDTGTNKAVGATDDNSTIADDHDMPPAENQTLATTGGSDAIPSVVHTPQQVTTTDESKSEAIAAAVDSEPAIAADAVMDSKPAPSVSEIVDSKPASSVAAPPPVAHDSASAVSAPDTATAASAPIALASDGLPGAPKTPTAPSLFQQYRRRPYEEDLAETPVAPARAAAAMPPRSEKKMNIQDMSGFTPFKKEQHPDPTAASPVAPMQQPEEDEPGAIHETPPQQPQVLLEENIDEPLIPDEEEEAVVVEPTNYVERIQAAVLEGGLAAQAHAMIIWQTTQEWVTNYLDPGAPYMDEDGEEVIPSVMEEWSFWLIVMFVLQLILYFAFGSSFMFYDTAYQATASTFLPEPPVDLYPRLQELRVELEGAHNEEKQAIRLVKKKSNDLQTMLATHEATIAKQLEAYTTSEAKHRLQLDFNKLWPIENCTVSSSAMTETFLVKLKKDQEAEEKRVLAKIEPRVRSLAKSLLPNTTSTTGQSPFITEFDKLILERFEKDRADTDRAHIGRGSTLVYASTPTVTPQLGNRLGMALGLLPSYGGARAALTADGTCWAIRSYGELVVEFAEPLYVHAVAIEQRNPEALIRSFVVSGYAAGSDKEIRLGMFDYKRRRDEPKQVFPIPDQILQRPVPPLKRIRLNIDSVWEEPFACLHRFRVYGEEEESEEDNNDDLDEYNQNRM